MMKIINIPPTDVHNEKNHHWQQNCIHLNIGGQGRESIVTHTENKDLLQKQGKGNLPAQPKQALCYFLRGILDHPSYPSQQSDKMDE